MFNLSRHNIRNCEKKIYDYKVLLFTKDTKGVDISVTLNKSHSKFACFFANFRSDRLFWNELNHIFPFHRYKMDDANWISISMLRSLILFFSHFFQLDLI